MEERYYFSDLGILCKVHFDDTANTIQYATHQHLDVENREKVQSLILKQIGRKTNFYKKVPAIIIYSGVEEALEKELSFYTLKDTIKSVITHREIVEQQVKSVITLSLKDYYFDQLGDALVTLRNCLNDNPDQFIIDQHIENIHTLLNAYNENAGKNLSLEQILPEEVLPGIK